VSIFRERQIVKKRRRWMTMLRKVERILISVVIVIAGLTALYGIYVMVCFGDAFAIKRIEIEGDWKYLSAERLATEAAITEGESLFWLSMDDVHARLKNNPWVKATVVRRMLPDTLWIYAEEYRPRAIVFADGFFYTDETGVLFKVPEAGEEKDFPVLSGIKVLEGRKLDDKNSERLLSMLGIISSFEKSAAGLEHGIAEVNFDKERGYSIITREKPMQIYLGHAAAQDAFKMIDDILPEVKKRFARIKYMLANEPERLVVKYQTS